MFDACYPFSNLLTLTCEKAILPERRGSRQVVKQLWMNALELLAIHSDNFFKNFINEFKPIKKKEEEEGSHCRRYYVKEFSPHCCSRAKVALEGGHVDGRGYILLKVYSQRQAMAAGSIWSCQRGWIGGNKTETGVWCFREMVRRTEQARNAETWRKPLAQATERESSLNRLRRWQPRVSVANWMEEETRVKVWSLGLLQGPVAPTDQWEALQTQSQLQRI